MNLLKNFKFILASASPRRINLLKNLDLNFKIVKPEVKEINCISKNNFNDVAIINSYRKAKYVAEIFKNDFIAAFDTIVVIGNKILGKPKNKEEAFKMLSILSGKKHHVVTGFTIINLNSNIEIKKSVVTEVYFKELTKNEINWYISTNEPFDKAGAYGIQGKGAFMITKINGSYTNVVGLPLTEFISVLEELNNG